jgi:aryl-alcohol dehydrogenase-like predicted oxidoreductase
MRYKLLGHSGLRVSEICLGTMGFGESWRQINLATTKEESRKILDAFVEAGGNFIDTACNYNDGHSETLLGEFLGKERERFVVATKYTLSTRPDDPNGCGNHRKNMTQSLEASLRRLKTDYVDLLWLHAWDFMTPIEEVMRGFDDMVRAGKALYVGFSDAPAWIVSRGHTLAEVKGWTPVAAIQMQYSLIERGIERELLPMARELDIGVTAWSPLGMGLLSGKYGRSAGSRGGSDRLDNPAFAEYRSERNLAIAEKVDSVARSIGRRPSQVALNWVRQKGTIPIVGSKKLAQIEENLACLDFELSPEQMRTLDDASRIERGFPYDFLDDPRTRGYLFGKTFDLIDNHRRPAVPTGGRPAVAETVAAATSRGR